MSTKRAISSLRNDMAVKLQIIAVIICSSMLFFGCNSSDDLETDFELQKYFQIFADEAAMRGFTVDYEAERIEGLLQNIPEASIQGQCFRNEDKPKKVIIDTDYWASADELGKEFIIFHELGHCFLGRDHLDQSDANGKCISIMHSNPGACNFLFNNQSREGYLDELFFQ